MIGLQVVTSINNLILGKLYIDHGGIMRVVHEPSGLQVTRKPLHPTCWSLHSALESHPA